MPSFGPSVWYAFPARHPLSIDKRAANRALLTVQYIYYQSPAYLNLRELWTAWPDREITGIMKGYMIAQLGFWLQQLIVINIEEKRKDHWQMFTHHIVTSVLIYASYRYGHTRVGNLILVLMDVSDLVLGVRETEHPIICLLLNLLSCFVC